MYIVEEFIFYPKNLLCVFQITGVAMDWNTKALYYADDFHNLIGVTGVGTGLTRDVHQILFSINIDRPVGIVVQPDQG